MQVLKGASAKSQSGTANDPASQIQPGIQPGGWSMSASTPANMEAAHYLSMFTCTLCQELLPSPRRFHTERGLSGCVLCAASTALLTMVTSLPTGISIVTSQKVHAHALPFGCSDPSRSCAVYQELPPSADTSTRTMRRPPPLHAMPATVTSSVSSVVPGEGETMKEVTGISCIGATLDTSIPSTAVTDGLNVLYAIPRCHTPSASSSDATIFRSHLMFRTPT
mmetsp:Transcript_11926/g.20117  ORF Transcript_11926/g.20117 Transcript_11926/m.20117 type:complete len:223 (+) Transcript_11926:287-955(+)